MLGCVYVCGGVGGTEKEGYKGLQLLTNTTLLFLQIRFFLLVFLPKNIALVKAIIYQISCQPAIMSVAPSGLFKNYSTSGLANKIIIDVEWTIPIL